MSVVNRLEPQQRLFVYEYVKDFVVSRAARRVGVAPTTGFAWIALPHVQEAVAEVMEERVLRTQIDADWVLTQLGTMFQADIGDIFDDLGALRPIHEWPEVWRKMCQGIKVNELWDGYGADRTIAGQIKDVKFIDRLRAIELIGKHTNVRAFLDRTEHTTDGDLVEKLLQGRRRTRKLRGEADNVSETMSFL